MSVKFWGRTLNPGETYTMRASGILELRQVSLSETPKQGKTAIKIKVKGHTFTLCMLDRNLVESQSLNHVLIAEDKATLSVHGVNPVHFTGSMITDTDASSSEDDMDYAPTQISQDQVMGESDEEEEDEERETITGQPRYANYLSDLLGPDLPDDDDDDYEDMDDDEEEEGDGFGTMAFRDPTDNEFLGGFELRHFNLAPNVPGYAVVDLRKQEKDAEDTELHDSIATGLVNALLNSGDDFQIEKGRDFMKRLKKQLKKRKRLEEQQQ